MKKLPSICRYMMTAVIAVVFIGRIHAAENATVALIAKAVQDVTKKTAPADWTKASKGDALISGDQIQTGLKSLAVVKFTDNSIVRVREQSELTITGESSRPRTLSKDVHLTKGAFGFDIKKQKQNEEFRFTSPTSVASIRGTLGSNTRGDRFTAVVVVEGLINLLNTVSKNEVDVPAGYIGFSNDDGSVSSRKATDEELADASNLATGGSSNDINLELKDGRGNKKDLKIKFKK